MLFNDQSGSMGGTPFAALQAGCIELAETIFDESDDQEKHAFEQVHTVFFESYCHPTRTSKKEEYLKRIKKERVKGGTDFRPCIKLIQDTVYAGAK